MAIRFRTPAFDFSLRPQHNQVPGRPHPEIGSQLHMREILDPGTLADAVGPIGGSVGRLFDAWSRAVRGR
ncbi:hypothetical protein ACWDKQ_11600 [Saccharopolyspora sp. NPDC000995]